MATLAELESALIGAVDKLAGETGLLNQLRRSDLDKDLLDHINNWRRYNNQRVKAIVNLQKLLEVRQTESRRPVQKAMASLSQITPGQIVATLIRRKVLKTNETDSSTHSRFGR